MAETRTSHSRNRRARAAVALGLLAALAGCAPGTGGAPDMLREAAAAEQAWRQAYVILPGESEAARLAAAAPRLARQVPHGPVPVVVFAHGCGGFDADSAETFRLLAAHGFAAIAPDHFARPDARLGCATADNATPRRGRAAERLAAAGPPPDGAYVGRRLDEISLAVWRVRELPWVDRGQVFLVGHSLGHGTAGLWPVRNVAAAAVLGQECRAARPGAAPIAALPLAVAVLPLGAATATEEGCSDWAMLPEATGGTLFGTPRADAASRPEARRALLDFLQRQRRG